jgi:hypothetical protein
MLQRQRVGVKNGHSPKSVRNVSSLRNVRNVPMDRKGGVKADARTLAMDVRKGALRVAITGSSGISGISAMVDVMVDVMVGVMVDVMVDVISVMADATGLTDTVATDVVDVVDAIVDISVITEHTIWKSNAKNASSCKPERS